MRVPRDVFVLASMLLLLIGVARTADAQTKTSFSTPTTGTAFVVPAGVTTVTIKAWGGGGGADQGDGRWGGGAGYAQADITVTAGETLTIRVAGGGVNDTSGNRGGGGGGYSGVFRGATPLLISGGGGGGGSYSAGAPGGGMGAAWAANSGYGAGGGAGGDTDLGGGAHGTGDAGYAQNGSYLQGGQGGWVEPNQGIGAAGGLNGGGAAGKLPVSGRRSAGGGGGGYSGGGGGASHDDATYADSTGGGGGSNYFTGTQRVNLAGSATTAANTGDADYVTGVGKGGVPGSNGGAGLVVLIYTAPQTPQIAEYNAVGQLAATSTIYHVNNNLGIGTQTPAFKLDVVGQLNASTGLCIAGDCRTSWPQATSSPWSQAGTTVSYTGGTVGVGTATPAFKLDVQGGQLNASGGLCIAGDCKTSWPATTGPWSLSGTSASYSGGNVGIGTATPLKQLDVTGNDETTVWITNNNNGANLSSATPYAFASLQFAGRFGGSINDLARVYAYYTGDGTTRRSAIGLATSGPDGNVNRVYANELGNVGIGTITPQARLHVNGDVIVAGNIGAKYQDVAEWVDAIEPAEAGTVVVAVADQVNRVQQSARGYDTAVAGVVSAQPGVLLGDKGEGRIAVAQSGRVRVKVDASYGAVNAGDLLVTSPRKGYAMKSQPVMLGDTPIHRPGTILGKALEPLPSGEGEILVLLTLQ